MERKMEKKFPVGPYRLTRPLHMKQLFLKSGLKEWSSKWWWWRRVVDS